MYGIFMESYVIFKNYVGQGWWILAAIAVLIYLLISKDDWRIKLPLSVCSAMLLVAYFCPLTRKVFVRLLREGDTYYRILWMIPWGTLLAYGGCRLFRRHPRVGLVLCSVLIIISGRLVYRNTYVTRAENLYHIPQSVIHVCDVISPPEGSPRVRALFPAELVHFVRQYDTDILMPYGREIIASQWGYYNELHEIFEKSEVICAEDLLAASRQSQCMYIVIHEGRAIDVPLSACGLILVDTQDGYLIYRDPFIEGI